MTKDEKINLENWIRSRPTNIRKIIKKFPPHLCVRGKNGKGHYDLYSYDETKNGSIAFKVLHLNDSFLPGVLVFGVNPDSLVICGCNDN